jgi:hypothetical protein
MLTRYDSKGPARMMGAWLARFELREWITVILAESESYPTDPPDVLDYMEMRTGKNSNYPHILGSHFPPAQLPRMLREKTVGPGTPSAATNRNQVSR